MNDGACRRDRRRYAPETVKYCADGTGCTASYEPMCRWHKKLILQIFRKSVRCEFDFIIRAIARGVHLNTRQPVVLKDKLSNTAYAESFFFFFNDCAKFEFIKLLDL